MKTIEFSVGGMCLHLCLNGAALFDIYEKFGQKGRILDPIQGNGKKAFGNTCWMLWKLAEQGELARRWIGYQPERVPEEAKLRALLSPRDVLRAKTAIKDTVQLGLSMEAKEERPESIDLGLQKLKERDGSGDMTMAEYLAPLTRILGLTVREALMLTPGQTQDMVAQVARKE